MNELCSTRRESAETTPDEADENPMQRVLGKKGSGVNVVSALDYSDTTRYWMRCLSVYRFGLCSCRIAYWDTAVLVA